MARLYADENFPQPVVEALRVLGHDVLTCQESGRAGQGVVDADVLAFAHADGRIVLTLDRRDFLHLHKQSDAHSGMIACTYDPDFVGQAARIDAALGSSPDCAGRAIRVNRAPR